MATFGDVPVSTSVPTGSFVGTSDSQQITNKYIPPRVSTNAATANLNPDLSSFDCYHITGQTAGITVNNPTNSSAGDWLTIRIRDNGTQRAISWGSEYRAVTSLPANTTVGKTLYCIFIRNNTETKWDNVIQSLF